MAKHNRRPIRQDATLAFFHQTDHAGQDRNPPVAAQRRDPLRLLTPCAACVRGKLPSIDMESSMSEPGRAQPTLQIDNERVRVTQWRFAPGASTGWHRHAFAAAGGRLGRVDGS